MNPFQAFVASLEADVNINIDVNEASTSNEPELEVSSPVTEEVLPADTSVVEQEEVVDTVTAGVASLESIYQTLEQVSQERDTLTETEVSFMQIALSGIAKPMGGRASDLVPSIESDNFFERNDVVASMESIGAAMKAGAKAGYDAIKKLLIKMKEWFLNSTAKARQKVQILTQLARDAAFNGTYDISYSSFNGKGPVDSLKEYERFLDGILKSTDGVASYDSAYKTENSKEIGDKVNYTTTRFEGGKAKELTLMLARIYGKIATNKFLDRINKIEKDFSSITEAFSTAEGDEKAKEQENSVRRFQELRQGYANIVASIDKFKITKNTGAPTIEK